MLAQARRAEPSHLLRQRHGVAVAESGGSGEASAEEVVHMDMEGFRDKADEAINRQEIPPEQQQRVKKYFESLGH